MANKTDTVLEYIKIYGAKEHNLKNINVTIPRDTLTVITGLSGSGKSSLAFDTLFAEGQRRYIECLSAGAKQYLDMMKKPDVDKIEGLSPAISIEQKTLSSSPRSTVGTVTEIYDYLRLLFTKIGVQYSTEHNVPVIQKSRDQIFNEIIEDYQDKKIMVLAPIIRARKGHYRELFEQFTKQGFTKVRIDGVVKDIEQGMQLSRYKIHDIELVLDRLIPNKENENRLGESIDLALKKGDGVIYVLSETKAGKWQEQTFSIHYTCPISGEAYSKLAPNMFSFNSSYGACEKCNGLGYLQDFGKSLLIENQELSIKKGGIAFIDKSNTIILKQIEKISDKIGLDLDIPIQDIPKEILDIVLYGTEDLEINSEYSFGNEKIVYKHSFSGLIPILNHQYQTANRPKQKRMEKYMTETICDECNGGRLKKRSLFVRIEGKNIYEISSMNISECRKFINSALKKLKKRDKAIAKVVLTEIADRLEFLEEVGLNYLTLSRSSKSLSGGESQRIRLASQIGSKLVGIMYVLDEPSIGLHQHDNMKLINSLKKLRDLGNSLIVVEHDKQMILESDYLIDIGPGAGINGGEILISDEPKNLSKFKNSKSHTIKYLNDNHFHKIEKRREGNGKSLSLLGATGNNLQNVNLSLPLGKFIVVTGMSGSGKSSLINDTLVPALKRLISKSKEKSLDFVKLEGIENIDKVIEIDQTPIGKTPRSNPATYTGIFTLIRDFYSQLPEAKIRGYKVGRFSFNVAGGRCEECQGAGMKKIEMNFLPDVFVTCDVCNGDRYNKETLQVKYKGKSIAEVLSMPISEALPFFNEIPKLKRKLSVLNDVGLGYLTLGQQSPTLSGGEAQRVKLASELSKNSTGKTLYLLDEPTTGLHFEDINLLLKLLNKLTNKGNTIVVIEHNLDVIQAADWIIDMGPMGGNEGGKIIFEGTPEKIIKDKKSLTGKYLKQELN